MIVEQVKKELETMRAKVEAAIAHVNAGVNALNEEQVEKLEELLDDLDGAVFDGRVRIARLFGVVKKDVTEMAAEVSGAQVENQPEQTGAPSAEDLDKVAEEQKAVEETSGEQN